ncbi:MAG TPA: creatininase family protein, partial [Woeseiaceae bacterium]|nr:creatininase family protein [Woeseiaceae bacterium]
MTNCNHRFAAASVSLLSALLLCAAAMAQSASNAEREREIRAALNAPNPLPAVHSPWIEDLTYLEVRDRIRDGATTAIIPTGGMEQNGPYLVTGKHNVILQSLCPAIVSELGNALCAPIVPFVP